jgi:hypothetical protein
MRFAMLICILLFASCSAFSQDALAVYDKLIATADSQYNHHEYKAALSFYSAAFAAKEGMGKVRDRYKAAVCWAVLGKNDSAFFQLYRMAVKAKYMNYGEVLSEPRFVSLHTDKRWDALIELIKQNRKEIEESIKIDQ